MKINVITRHAPRNYGSLLQSIATIKVLDSLGFDSSIIDYQRKDERGMNATYTQARMKYGSNLIKILLYLFVRFPMEYISQCRFDKMRNYFLRMTKRCSNKDELRMLDADVFMTGSDQVWGPVIDGKYDPSYFLEFVDQKKKKIAYAASFGKTLFDANVIDEYIEFLRKYNHITVRENRAHELLNEWNVPCAGQVLDPTLLLNSDQWSEYIKEEPNIKGPYVLVYGIHHNSRLDKYAINFAKEVNLPLIRVSPALHQFYRGGKFIFCPSLSKFLSLIKNAAYMVTDSFHGTAFAINFNTQFIEVLANTGTASRNQSILQLTGLTDRVLIDDADFSFSKEMIDFSNANQTLKQEREKSLEMLKNIILS